MDTTQSTPTFTPLSPENVAMLDDLIADAFRQAPYNTPQRKLTDARMLVAAGCVAPAPDVAATWMVQGNDPTPYTVTAEGTCTCKYARTNPERPFPCDHAVAAALYARLQDRLNTQTPPTIDSSETHQDGSGSMNGTRAPDEHVNMLTGEIEAAPGDVQISGIPRTDPDAACHHSLHGTPKDGQRVHTPEQAVSEHQRGEIKRLLGLLDISVTTRREAREAVYRQVGLDMIPTQYPQIINRLEAVIRLRLRAMPAPKPFNFETFKETVHGKQHIKYIGLLACAHDQGLISLEADFVTVTADLAIAKATARFTDGRIFSEAGEATPNNVTPQLRPAFARMALTRAKARALRDALNIAEAAAEELGE